MNYFTFLFAIVSFCIVSTHGQLPDYITTCSRSDPKLNECALKYAKLASVKFARGDPSRGLDKIDPLIVKEARTGGNGNGPGITISLKDGLLTGTAGLEPKKVNFDVKKRKISVYLFGDLELESKYEISGRILVIPLSGSGNAHISLRDVKVHYSFEYDVVKRKDGLDYIKIKSDDIKQDVGKAHIKLDNLFNGDRVLGETTNRLLNEAWRDIIHELAPPVVRALKQQVTKVVKKLVSLAPYDEILTP